MPHPQVRGTADARRHARNAGILALAAAVLTAVEKFLTAGDKVGVLARRYQDLAALADEAKGAVADAQQKEASTANPTYLSLADYEAWLGTRASELDAKLKKINEMHSLV